MSLPLRSHGDLARARRSSAQLGDRGRIVFAGRREHRRAGDEHIGAGAGDSGAVSAAMPPSTSMSTSEPAAPIIRAQLRILGTTAR